jgi:hypothetical protein
MTQETNLNRCSITNDGFGRVGVDRIDDEHASACSRESRLPEHLQLIHQTVNGRMDVSNK